MNRPKKPKQPSQDEYAKMSDADHSKLHRKNLSYGQKLEVYENELRKVKLDNRPSYGDCLLALWSIHLMAADGKDLDMGVSFNRIYAVQDVAMLLGEVKKARQHVKCGEIFGNLKRNFWRYEEMYSTLVEENKMLREKLNLPPNPVKESIESAFDCLPLNMRKEMLEKLKEGKELQEPRKHQARLV